VRPTTVVLLCCWLPAAAWSQSLVELQDAAQAIDPVVAAASANARAAEQRVTQARAAFGPQVALTVGASQTRYQEVPGTASRSFHGNNTTVQMSQPVWRGGLWPGLDAAHAQAAQSQAALGQARADALQRLLEASFEVFKARDNVQLLQAQRVSAADQLGAANTSFRVGTRSITDVREAQARADIVAAQLVGAEYELDLRQQFVAELAGRPAPSLLQRGLDGKQLPALDAAALPDWLAQVGDNWQVQQAQQALVAAGAEIRRAWQGHAPTVDVTASYGRSNETGSVTSTFPRNANAGTVGVQLNVPLFSSGATQARVGEALALEDKARNDLEQARRSATLAVRQYFTATQSAVRQAQGLATAVESAEVALRANRRGYEVGVKVSGEVLDAQSRLFEAQRDLSRARYDAWLNWLRLQAAVGRLNDTEVARLDALLVAQKPNEPQPVAPRNR
jgi:outer membrane protein